MQALACVIRTREKPVMPRDDLQNQLYLDVLTQSQLYKRFSLRIQLCLWLSSLCLVRGPEEDAGSNPGWISVLFFGGGGQLSRQLLSYAAICSKCFFRRKCGEQQHNSVIPSQHLYIYLCSAHPNSTSQQEITAPPLFILSFRYRTSFQYIPL